MLHPHLNRILKILNKHQQSFSLSTNGSLIPKIGNSELFQNLNFIQITLPGFSQKSFDKIKKFDFQKVLLNIQVINELIPLNSLEIAFFAYLFNVREIEIARKFFQDLNIKFRVHLPFTMNIEDSIGFLNGTLPYQQKQTIDADIFTDHIKPMMKNYKTGYPCHYLQKQLIIDEYNQILICCAVPKNNVDYKVGSLLEMRIEDIISSKTLGKPICNRCMSAGVPYWYAHNDEGLNLFFEKNKEKV